jgi:hypothetical protein
VKFFDVQMQDKIRTRGRERGEMAHPALSTPHHLKMMIPTKRRRQK